MVVVRQIQPSHMRMHLLSCRYVDNEAVSLILIQSRRVELSVKQIWSCKTLFRHFQSTICIPNHTCPVHMNRPENEAWKICIRILTSRKHVEVSWGMVRRQQAQEVRVPLESQATDQAVVDHQWHRQKPTLCKRNATHPNSPSNN